MKEHAIKLWSNKVASPRRMFFDEDSLSQKFGNEFVFTHSKDYLYYLARSTLSQIFNNETSPQNLVYTSKLFFDKPTLPKKKCPWERSLTAIVEYLFSCKN